MSYCQLQCLNHGREEHADECQVKAVLKKCVVLQVNDAAVSLRLVVFVSEVQRFSIQITEQTGWGRGAHRTQKRGNL